MALDPEKKKGNGKKSHFGHVFLFGGLNQGGVKGIGETKGTASLLPLKSFISVHRPRKRLFLSEGYQGLRGRADTG